MLQKLFFLLSLAITVEACTDKTQTPAATDVLVIQDSAQSTSDAAPSDATDAGVACPQARDAATTDHPAVDASEPAC
jgi:hypothetical protein